MKTILVSIALSVFLFACSKENEYHISGKIQSEGDTVIVLNNWYVSSDTVPVVNGYFEFSGVIDTFPKLVSIGFPFPSQVRTRLILEPGRISVNYVKDKGFIIGGTDNNIILQDLIDEISPYDELVSNTWRKWSKVYLEEKVNIQKRDNCFDVGEYAKDVQREKVFSTIKANPNYAGFVMSLPVIRYLKEDSLRILINQFKQFSNDRNFQTLKEQFEASYYTNKHPAPEFTLPDPEGQMLSLSDFRGQWVLLDFWYDGCGWCKRLSPILKNIYNDWHNARNLEIISISVDKEYDRWIKGMKEENTPWIQVRDSTKTYPSEYAIIGYPTLILIDKEGNGVEKIIGFHEERSLKRLLAKHLDE